MTIYVFFIVSFHFLFSSHFSHASYSIFTKEIVYLFLCLAPNRYEPRLGRKEYTGEYSGSAITTVHVSCCGELDKCKRCTREEQNRRWGPLGTGQWAKVRLRKWKSVNGPTRFWSLSVGLLDPFTSTTILRPLLYNFIT